MGHQRLGEIPKSKKWSAVVETLTGEAPGTSGAATLTESVAKVADLTDVSSSFAMEQIKYTTALPLGD